MINIVFLCSEITRGMKSYGPKSTILLGKNREPLIVKQIKSIRKHYPSSNVHIVLGFGAQKIIKIISESKLENIEYVYHNNYENENNGSAFIMALNNCDNDTLIINNGVILTEKIKTKFSCVPVVKNKNIDGFDVGVTINNGSVQHMFYDLDNRWTETLFIDRNTIQTIKQILNEKKQILSYMFFFEIINYLIDQDIIFGTQEISSNKIQKIINHKL